MTYSDENPRRIRNLVESHATISAFAPMIVFCILLAMFVLLRTITVFAAVCARCTTNQEFWLESSTSDWPLALSFIVILVLMFLWNGLIAISEWRRSTGTRLVLSANAVGIIALLLVFPALDDSVPEAAEALYGDREWRPIYWSWEPNEGECVTLLRFAGTWQVAEKEVGFHGFDVPADRFDIKPWGYVHYQIEGSSWPLTGWWQPPRMQDESNSARWLGGYLIDTPWDFELNGDTLILETPIYFNEYYRSRVVLERVPDEEYGEVWARIYIRH